MVSSDMINEVLQGLDYPVDRAQIIMHATTHGAPERLLRVLYRIPERQYSALEDVWDEINALS